MSIPLSPGTALVIQEKDDPNPKYPSGRIQKGLVLWHDTIDLSEEGVGFGVPVLKRGHETVYPGSVRLHASGDGRTTLVESFYNLNIRERMYIGGKPVKGTALYRFRERFSRLHRRHPFLRTSLDRSNALIERAFPIRRAFEEGVSSGQASVEYRVDPGRQTISISLDLGHGRFDGRSEIFMMNELGASYFDEYHDSQGHHLKKKSIGAWEEVLSDEASFRDPAHWLSFTLAMIHGAKLFRGREFVPGKLAWAGLSYRLPEQATKFSYWIRIAGEARP